MFGCIQERAEDVAERRMAQRTHRAASFCYCKLTAGKMHKERIALRKGKPLTTDFQFLKSVKTRRLLSDCPFFLRLSSAASPCNVRKLLHGPSSRSW